MSQYDDGIAIVGMGCRFPGSANSVQQYWENIKKGMDCITEVPENRWSKEEFYHYNSNVPGKSHSKWGGYIDNFDEFDAAFFGINGREAEQIDPQQRQLLEITWEALEDANMKPKDYVHSKTGVFIGGFVLDYKILQFADTKEIDTHTAVGSMMTMLSNRISYIYDFTGPAMSIDTACSSALVAIHEACQSLKNRECNMAVSGGMELIYTPEYYIAESKGGFLSKDGRCKTFDARANGYVRGEGGGVLILKRLEDAVKDGNNIYAVIRGSLVNQDGKTVGITVPNGDQQKQLLKEVYGRAGIDPKDVQYVELHGTGTKVGDPIESNVIAEFFGGERDKPQDKCIIASVKANIGHLEAAAGVASVIKAVSSMQERVIAPHIGMKELNPEIKLGDLNIRIPEKLEPWPKDGKLQTVGVNSFGFGGTNAHIILQEYPREEAVYDGRRKHEARPVALTISAKSEYSLKKNAEKYAELLITTKASAEAVCYAAATNREMHNKRVTIIGNAKEELTENLYRFMEGKEDNKIVAGNESKDQRLAFVFTGMGPQWYAMGRELYNTDRVFHDTVCRVDKAFCKYLSWSIIDEMMLEEETSHIARTDVSQPMNFTIQVALYEMWKSMGIVPDVIVGHSVGEVSAFYAAGVYDLEEAIKISFHRSRCQFKLTGKGGMLAVGLPAEEAESYIKGVEGSVSIAAINSNTSVTLSGNVAELQKIAVRLEEKLIFNQFLKVNVPYHSVYMNEIKEEFLDSIGELHPKKGRIRLFTTADGELSDGTNLNKHYWWKNISNAVHFAKAAANILKEGYMNFVEVGPHPVLAKSIQELAEELKTEVLIVPSIRRKEPEMQCMFKTYARIINAGVKVNFSEVYTGSLEPVKLPAYQWEHKRYWKEPFVHEQRRLGRKDHILLGYRNNSVAPVWEAEINDYTLPFIKDHRINGQAVIAGAQYIETAFQLIKNQCALKENDFYEISDIKFLKAVFLDQNNIANLSISYDKKNGLVRVHSSNTADMKEAVVNFEAAVRRRQIARPVNKGNFGKIKAACAKELSGQECYDIFKKAGFEYGPAFQGISAAWVGENETFIELRTLEELKERDMECVFHPLLLDAAFQGLIANQYGAKQDSEEAELKLPVSIDRITVYKKCAGKLYAYSKLTQCSEKEITGDIMVFDEEENIAAEIKGFTARTLENDDEHTALSERSLNDWCYSIEWREQNREDDEPLLSKAMECDHWIIFGDHNGTGEKLSQKLQKSGKACTLLYGHYDNNEAKTPSTDEEVRNGILQICQGLNSNTHYGVVFMCGLDVSFKDQQTSLHDIEEGKRRLLNPIRHIVNGFNENSINYHIWVVTSNAVRIHEEDKINVNQASSIGMCRVIAQNESITTWGANIDIDSEDISLDMLCDDLLHLTRENEIAYRGAKRYASRLEHITGLSGFVPVIFDSRKYYIISGGFGSLGQITAKWMVEQGARHIVLFGRAKLSESNPADEKKLQFIKELKQKGAIVEQVSLDVQDEKEVYSFFKDLKENKKAVVGGIFHTAGVLRDELMTSMTQQQFDEVYDTKAKGAWNLSNCIWNDNLDFFVTYSSASAVVTAVGQTNYAAANSFMDALAYYRSLNGRPGQSIAWGPWGVGMINDRNLTEYYKLVRGMEPIYAGTGMQALERVLGQDKTHVVICGVNWPQALTNFPNNPPLFNYLAEEMAEDTSKEEDINLMDALVFLEDEEQRLQKLMDYYADIVSEITYIPGESINREEPLIAIGVDSIIATEIRNKINEKFGITIAITDILGGLSLSKIAEKSFVLLAPQLESRQEELEKMLTELDNMSDEAVKSLLVN
jgi:acyl transferase domain-containing protein/acyl carrier protein